MIWSVDKKLLVFLDQAVFSGSQFFINIIIARSLNIYDFGVYSAFVLICHLAISLIGAWTIQVFQVQKNTLHSHASFVVMLHFLMGLFLSISLVSIDVFFDMIYTSIAVWWGFGFLMYDVGRRLLLAMELYKWVLIVDIVIGVLSCVIIFLLRYYDLLDLQQVFLSFGGLYGVLMLLLCVRFLPKKSEVLLYFTYFKQHVREGKWLFLTAMTQWGSSNLIVASSGIFIGPIALGALRLAQSIFGVLNVVLQGFENYILPRSVQHLVHGHSRGISYVLSVSQKLVFIFLPILTLIFVFARALFIGIGGEAYDEYSFIVRWLCVLYLFVLVGQPYRFVIRTLKLNNHFFYGYLMSLMYTLFISYWIIDTYGLQGVLAGLIGAQCIVIGYWSIILNTKNIHLWKSYISF